MRSHPAKHGEGFDAPPTLERSGSERRGGAVTSFLLRRKAWLEVELPLAKGRRRDSKDSFLATGNLKHFPKEPQVILRSRTHNPGI